MCFKKLPDMKAQVLERVAEQPPRSCTRSTRTRLLGELRTEDAGGKGAHCTIEARPATGILPPPQGPDFFVWPEAP